MAAAQKTAQSSAPASQQQVNGASGSAPGAQSIPTGAGDGEDTSQLSASPSSLYNNVNGESFYGNVEEQSSLSRGRLRDLLIKQPDPVPLVPPRPHEQNEKKE